MIAGIRAKQHNQCCCSLFEFSALPAFISSVVCAFNKTPFSSKAAHSKHNASAMYTEGCTQSADSAPHLPCTVLATEIRPLSGASSS